MKKRILALLLCVCMVLGMSLNVFAHPTEAYFYVSSRTSVEVGQTIPVEIRVEAGDVEKMGFRVPFDTEYLKYVSHEVTYDFPGTYDVTVGDGYIDFAQAGGTYDLSYNLVFKATFEVLKPCDRYVFTIDTDHTYVYCGWDLEPVVEDFISMFKEKCVNHTFENMVDDPTCTRIGFIYEQCSNCGFIQNNVTTPALGHECVDGFCIRCGEEEGVWVSGEHNDHIWKLLGDLESEKTLVIGGEGAIEDNDDVALIWHEWNLGVADDATSVIVEEGITRMGDIAFHNLRKVHTVELPSTLTAIGDKAFEDCVKLSTLKFKGTRAQWEAVSIGESNGRLSEGSVRIVCADDAAHEHVRDNGYIHRKPTCLEDGLIGFACRECGAFMGAFPIPATDHAYENGICIHCGEAEMANDFGLFLTKSKFAYTGEDLMWMFRNVIAAENVDLNDYSFNFSVIDKDGIYLEELIDMGEYDFEVYVYDEEGNIVATELFPIRVVEDAGDHPLFISLAKTEYTTLGYEVIDEVIQNIVYKNAAGEAVDVYGMHFGFSEVEPNKPGTYEVSVAVCVPHPADGYYVGVATLKYQIVEKSEAADEEIGHLNDDGEINNIDAMLALQFAVGLIDDANVNMEAADVNGDGEVNNIDAMLILQYAVGLISKFPVAK